MLNRDIISMPDKWEYPWYAAWDLAFHTLPISIVDPDFAKDQMTLMLRGSYLHPNGQIPAYEWNFSDVNPPVHAFATLFLYRTAHGAARRSGRGFPQGDVQQARAELHLVGQPQGPLRQERVRGRLPRARQHRRLRPKRPVADGRVSRTGGRHGVDGALQPEHARARHRARHARSRFTKRWCSSSSSTSTTSRRGSTGPGGTGCGTRRMASTTTCCDCPTAAPRGSRCARWSGSSRCAPPR